MNGWIGGCVCDYICTVHTVVISPQCVSDVWEAFAAVEAALIGGNESQVWKDFSCCEDPSSLDDQIELISSLADLIAGTVEYNEIEGTMSIDELCVLMTNQSEKYEEEIEAYDRLVKLVEVSYGTSPFV